jgi:aminoacyl-tRNA hydrolase
MRWPRLRRVAKRLASRRRELAKRVLAWRAALHRRRLDGVVTFVAITGSTAKTTTRDLVAAVLSVAGPVHRARKPANLIPSNVRLVLAARPTDPYCVVETPTARPGYVARSLRFVRPRIGIVTNVGTDHRANFGSVDAIAEEKGTLVAALPADGVAILNADDPRVLAMRSRTAGRVVTYGRSSAADVRGEDVGGAWPERLSFTARYGGEAVRVRTLLCGEHWVSAVLAALAAGVAEGIPLEAAAEAVGRVEPAPGRLSVVAHDDGVTFIRDDQKAPLPSIAPALDFLRSARALRKIAVIGTVSDYPGSSRSCYRRVARAAAEAADLVIFAGPRASLGLRGRRHPADPILTFHSVRDASSYLDGVLRPGDLVLLKGSNTADHLQRIVLARTQEVSCWRGRCGKTRFCDHCRLLTAAPAGPAPRAAGDPAPGLATLDAAPDEGPRLAPGICVVVGLGNPGPQHQGTPHNVGQAAVDVLAGMMGAEWARDGQAWLARGEHDGRPLCLVRLVTPMNGSGPALRALSSRLGFDPGSCVVVYDDVDLPLGKVRIRERGSSGGHLGLESILEELQSGEIRRVKIGVGRPENARATTDFLLAPFPAADRPAMDQACEQAARKVLDLVAAAAR